MNLATGLLGAAGKLSRSAEEVVESIKKERYALRCAPRVPAHADPELAVHHVKDPELLELQRELDGVFEGLFDGPARLCVIAVRVVPGDAVVPDIEGA